MVAKVVIGSLSAYIAIPAGTVPAAVAYVANMYMEEYVNELSKPIGMFIFDGVEKWAQDVVLPILYSFMKQLAMEEIEAPPVRPAIEAPSELLITAEQSN
jgi:hypothetical protein